MGTARARRVRRERAAALERLRAGAAVRRVLERVPDGYGSIPVHLVLGACPGLGPITCREVLERARVWPLTPLSKLTREQRWSVIEALPDRIL
jgi:hypothetical protein